MPMKAPITATGMVTAGTMVARAETRKAKITSTTSTTAMPSACITSPDQLVDEHGIVGADLDFHALRQERAQQIDLLAHPVRDGDRVGLRLADHAEPDQLAAVRADDGLVVLDPALDLGDVGEADRVAVDPLDHDLAELLDGRQPALGAHRELARGRAQLAGRQLDVVAPQRRLDVVDREIARRHRPAVEPDPDRVAPLAEDLDLGDAFERRQPVDDEALHVVRDLGRGQPGAGDRDPHDRVGVAVALGDLRLVDLVGQVDAHPATASRTSLAASSMLRPVSNSITVRPRPRWLEDVDRLDAGDPGDRALDHLGDVGVDDLGRRADVGRGDAR